MTKDRNRVTPEGKAMGEQMVRLAEPMIRHLANSGETDDRCPSCAFRLGTVPNGCLQTQMDVMKAVVENVPFCCHQHDRKGWPCHGWYAARIAIRDAELRKGEKLEATCPWEFSPPDPEDT